MNDEKLVPTIFLVIGITLIVLFVIVIGQAVVVRQRYEIVQAVVVGYDLDNMLLFVTHDTDDEQVVVVVEVLLKETEASVTVAAERDRLIGRRVAYLSRQNEKVLLTIFTPHEEEQNANTLVY